MRSDFSVCAVFLAALGCGGSSARAVDPLPLPAPTTVPNATTSLPSTTASVAERPLVGEAPVPGAGSAPTLASQCDGVVLELTNVAAKDGSLSLDASLKNTGKKSYPLIATMDGSSFGRRNPTITFSMSPAETKDPGLCGFMNEMTDADFFTRAPGATKKLEWVHAPVPARPGAYTIRVTYTNDVAQSLQGTHGESKFTARIKGTVACQVTSAPVTVVVK